MTPKLVQYFKGAQDRARASPAGRCAPPRLALDEADTRDPRGRGRRAARAGRRLSGCARRAPSRRSTPTPRGCRRASSPAASAPIPGATMLERKLHFEARAGRPAAAAHARAARARRDVGRDPPAADAAGRRLGRAVHRGRGLPADVRARDDRRRHRARRDRHGRGDASPRPSCGSTRRPGWSRRASRCEDGRARSVTLRNVPSFLHAARPRGRGARARARRLRHGLRRQLLRAAAAPPPSGWRSIPARADELIEARARDHGRDRRRRPPGASRATRGSPAATTSSSTRPGRDGADARAATVDPPRLARPLAVRHRDVGAARPAARARRAGGRRGVRQRVGDRHALHRAGWSEETTVAGRPAIVPEITGRAWITGMGQYLLDAEDPFPAGFAL